jgi:hypothetical protein
MLRRTLPFLVGLCACGSSITFLGNGLPPVPTISSFTADPSSLDAGGGTSLLSWTVVNEDNLELQPGAANVSGYTSAKVTVVTTTTYTLSASNSLGETSSTVTVTVGP